MSSEKENYPRSEKGFQSVFSSLKETTKKLFGKNGFVELDIITNWEEIAGEKLAEFSHPQSIDFKRGERNNGVLNIAVDGGAFAIEIMHKKKNIIEKINTYFGYGAVSDLRVLQINIANTAKKPAQSTGENKTLVRLKEQNYIEEQTSDIENPQLKSTLQKLGNNIFNQEEKNEDRKNS